MSTGNCDPNCKNESPLLGLLVECWRLHAGCAPQLQQLEKSVVKPLTNRFRYFRNRLEESLAELGLKLLEIDGQVFGPGLPFHVLNITEQSEPEGLIVTQTLEPAIVNSTDGRIVRMGTVTVGSGNI